MRLAEQEGSQVGPVPAKGYAGPGWGAQRKGQGLESRFEHEQKGSEVR